MSSTISEANIQSILMKLPKQFTELVDYLDDELRRGLSEETSPNTRLIACKQASRLALELGGTHWYIPKFDALNKLIRDKEISEKHDGTMDGPNGTITLARRYGVSVPKVMAILKQQREIRLREISERENAT